MDNQPVIKKTYKTFKEAFTALPEATRQHSLRVADYTRVLFLQAIAVEMRMGNATAAAQLEAEHERAAYLCGLYHDIGKVLVPIQYHQQDPSYSAEEVALYRKHTTDGVALARQMVYGEELSDLEQKMILSAMENHHMRPDSPDGFPEVKSESAIPLMALLTGFANYLDHQVTVVRSETPFEDVMEQVMKDLPEEGELHLLLGESRGRLRRVFAKYQEQSLKIPTPIPFVKRKPNRPFELKYRPIVDRKHKSTMALQAKMYFKDAKDIFVEYDEVRTILQKNKMIPDLGRYYLYEAGDMIKRIEACELPFQYVALELMPNFYSQPKVTLVIKQQLEDARMPLGKLVLAMDEAGLASPSKTMMNNLAQMTAADIPLMLTGWTTDFMHVEDILKYSFRMVALHPGMYPHLEEEALQGQIRQLVEAGVQVIAGELDKNKYSGILNSLEVTTMTGPMAGDYLTEDEVILGELKLQE